MWRKQRYPSAKKRVAVAHVWLGRKCVAEMSILASKREVMNSWTSRNKLENEVVGWKQTEQIVLNKYIFLKINTRTSIWHAGAKQIPRFLILSLTGSWLHDKFKSRSWNLITDRSLSHITGSSSRAVLLCATRDKSKGNKKAVWGALRPLLKSIKCRFFSFFIQI